MRLVNVDTQPIANTVRTVGEHANTIFGQAAGMFNATFAKDAGKVNTTIAEGTAAMKATCGKADALMNGTQRTGMCHPSLHHPITIAR